jgi:hypothetical protein
VETDLSRLRAAGFGLRIPGLGKVPISHLLNLVRKKLYEPLILLAEVGAAP